MYRVAKKRAIKMNRRKRENDFFRQTIRRALVVLLSVIHGLCDVGLLMSRSMVTLE